MVAVSRSRPRIPSSTRSSWHLSTQVRLDRHTVTTRTTWTLEHAAQRRWLSLGIGNSDESSSDRTVPDVPWQRASAAKQARRSEEQGAKAHKGKRQAASGGTRGRKGDIRSRRFLIQDKTTGADSYRITADNWEAACHDALTSPPTLLPAFRVTIRGHTLLIARESDILALLDG